MIRFRDMDVDLAFEFLTDDELIEAVYNPLRRIARSMLHRNRDWSFGPTELVNHTFTYKLLGKVKCAVSANHFLHIAIDAMRQQVIDRGRKRAFRSSVKLGLPTTVDSESSELVVMVRREIKSLAKVNFKAAEIVKLRVLDGHTWDEIAKLQNAPVRTIRDEFEFAIAWLRSRFAV